MSIEKLNKSIFLNKRFIYILFIKNILCHCSSQVDCMKFILVCKLFRIFRAGLTFQAATAFTTNASICIWLNARDAEWCVCGSATPHPPTFPTLYVYEYISVSMVNVYSRPSAGQWVSVSRCHPLSIFRQQSAFPYSTLHSELRDVHGR